MVDRCKFSIKFVMRTVGNYITTNSIILVLVLSSVGGSTGHVRNLEVRVCRGDEKP